MEANTSFDAFKLCWDVIKHESTECDNNFFNAEHCKIIDSRDSNFNVLENRLAYTYKYGCFNILLFEKCFSIYINQCSKALFSFDNLKVCSLSNGPGFDIIGLLRALSISNKPLKGLPIFNAINLHGSWSELYKLLINKTYETLTYTAKSFAGCFHLSQTNIKLIEGDIYSTLSPEVKDYISNSNVLLMVNVFMSSKATPTTFEKTLKEIFTLLTPGSLIFFIGSKNNLKLFSKLADLKQLVKCVFGPQKVTLENLPTDEQITNIIGVKPLDSGHANFIVWQKKNQILKSPHGDIKSLEEDTAIEYKDDSDTMSDFSPSESSITSSIENFGTLKHDLKSSDKSKSGQVNCKLTSSSVYLNQNLNPIENITTTLNGIQLNPKNCQETNSMADSATNLILNNSSNKLITNDTKVISQNTSNKKCEKKTDPKKKTEAQSINCTDNSVQLLLQQCGSLISKLEELTVSVKKDLNSSRKCQTVNKTHFYNPQTENCAAIHHHCCCVKIIHCCCRNFHR